MAIVKASYYLSIGKYLSDNKVEWLAYDLHPESKKDDSDVDSWPILLQIIWSGHPSVILCNN